MRHFTLFAVLLAVSPGTVSAQDNKPSWPQWRGPNLDGISTETTWKVAGKKGELWLTNVGIGYSTVSVANGKLYTTGNDPNAQKDTVVCIDPETGFDVWAYTYACSTMARMHGGGSLSTPSVDGKRVWVSNREGKLLCLDSKTGKLLWQKDLKEDYDLRLPMWGFAASPLVLDDMVVLAMGYVFAFDRKGEIIWKSKENYRESYSTPTVAKIRGRDCLVAFNGAGVVILDRKDGKEIARHAFSTRSRVNAATPVVIGNKIFVSSGYNKGCAMFEATADGLEPVWESRVMRNHMSGCVYKDGHLYGFDESTLKCIDLDGEVKWAQRGLGKGALVMAGDKLLIMSSRGDFVIAGANPKEFKELSRVHALSGGVNWTTPVLCDGRIYCRNSLGDLVCLDHRASTK